MLATYVVPRFEVPRATYLEKYGKENRTYLRRVSSRNLSSNLKERMLQHFKIASMRPKNNILH